jgi:hypothetical protein
MFVEDGLDAAATLGWEATEEDFQPGEEQVFGNEGQELGEGDLEGDECLDGVAGAGMDGGDGALEVSGKSLRVGGELLGKVAKAGGPEGMGVVAGLEGIEVAGGRAAATGAELGVAMGAAMGVAAHGPVAAAGHLTAGFVGISGHFRSLGRHYSTNVLFCQMGLRAWRYPLLCKDHWQRMLRETDKRMKPADGLPAVDGSIQLDTADSIVRAPIRWPQLHWTALRQHALSHHASHSQNGYNKVGNDNRGAYGQVWLGGGELGMDGAQTPAKDGDSDTQN